MIQTHESDSARDEACLRGEKKEYLAVSTAFAILFWLSVAATIVSTVLAVRNRRKPPRRRPAK